MFTPSEPIKKALSDMGRNADGRAMIQALDEAKDYYQSITNIDKTRPTEPQVEGRELMCEMIDQFKQLIQHKKHRVRPGEVEDYS